MKAEEKFVFSKMLGKIAELYDKTLSANRLEIYWNVFEKYDLEEIKRALNLHLVNPDKGQFMPKPADIMHYLEKSHSLKSLDAWDKVMKAIRNAGSSYSVEFDDPLISVLINKMGGWISLSQLDNKDLTFKALEFQRRYETHLLYPRAVEPESLPGSYELLNRANGYLEHIPKPVFFGDKDTKLLTSPSKSDEEKTND